MARMWPDPKPAGGPLPRGNHGRKPPPPPPHRSREGGCCAMAAAGRAARRGRFRLARRYAVMSVRLIAARLA